MLQTAANPRPAASRLARLQELMDEHDLSGVILSSLQNVAYFSGTYLITQTLVPDRLAFVVVRRGGDPALLVCDIEESLVRLESPIEDVRIYVEFEREPVDVLAELLREFGLGDARIAIDRRRLPGESLLALQRALPRSTLVALDDAIEGLQMQKDEREIALLSEAARATQRAVETAVAESQLGVTEQHLAGRIFAGLAEAGGAPLFLVLGSGERSMIAHPDPLDSPMAEGAIFRVDTGARFREGLLSDLARTGVVGEPSDVQQETLRALRRTQTAAFELMEPGRPVRDLYEACKRAFADNDLPFGMPHIGHGLGIALHESPRIHPGAETPLEPGMILNIEPLVIFAERQEAYHVEDLVLITADGHEVLTTPQETLLAIGTR